MGRTEPPLLTVRHGNVVMSSKPSISLFYHFTERNYYNIIDFRSSTVIVISALGNITRLCKYSRVQIFKRH